MMSLHERAAYYVSTRRMRRQKSSLSPTVDGCPSRLFERTQRGCFDVRRTSASASYLRLLRVRHIRHFDLVVVGRIPS